MVHLVDDYFKQIMMILVTRTIIHPHPREAQRSLPVGRLNNHKITSLPT